MFKKFQNEKGFSLAELLIVISIIGILAGIVMMNMNGSQRSAKAAKLRGNLVTLREALLAYKLDHGFFPCTSSDYNKRGNVKTFKRQLTWYTNAAGRPSQTKTAAYMYGPYLQEFPVEAITNSSKVVIDKTGERVLTALQKYVAGLSSAKGGWYYEAKTGQVVPYLNSKTYGNEYVYY
jgi:prepilin-type N-terminal cleavage/methylation domain-containing protein